MVHWKNKGAIGSLEIFLHANFLRTATFLYTVSHQAQLLGRQTYITAFMEPSLMV